VQPPPAQQAQQQQDGEQQPCKCANQDAQDPSEVRLGAACMAASSGITCTTSEPFMLVFRGAHSVMWDRPGLRTESITPTALHFHRAKV
jgi:hypothetical protein